MAKSLPALFFLIVYGCTAWDFVCVFGAGVLQDASLGTEMWKLERTGWSWKTGVGSAVGSTSDEIERIACIAPAEVCTTLLRLSC